jgi:hypothetical protein
MSVTVDHEKLDVQTSGLQTVGQVIQQLQKSRRLIVRLVIDGDAPDLTNMPAIQRLPLAGHTIFIETVDPLEASLEVLVNAYTELNRADQFKAEASDLLRSNKWGEAMEKLRQCLALWQGAQRAIVTVGKLFKIDVEQMIVATRPLRALSEDFARQLNNLQAAIQSVDLVGVSDVLIYETAHTGDTWRAAIEALRAVIRQPVAVQSVA